MRRNSSGESSSSVNRCLILPSLRLSRELANHVRQNRTAFLRLFLGQIHGRQQTNHCAVRAIHQESPREAFFDNGGSIHNQLDADHYAGDTHLTNEIALLGQRTEAALEQLAELLCIVE